MDCVSIIFLACIISLIISSILLVVVCSTKKRIADKNEKIEVLSKNIFEASAELARTRQSLSEEKTISENLSNQNSLLYQDVEKLKTEITSNEVRLAHLDAYTKECELNVHDSKDRLERTRASLDRTKAELEEWKKFGNKHAENLQSIRKEAYEISTMFDDITESIEALKLDINSIDVKLTKAISVEV